MLNNKTLIIHISCEIVVLSIIVFWSVRNNKKLNDKITELETKVDNYENRIKELENTVKEMIQVIDNFLKQGVNRETPMEKPMEKPRETPMEKPREKHRETHRETPRETRHRMESPVVKKVKKSIKNQQVKDVSDLEIKEDVSEISETESMLDKYLENELKELEMEEEESNLISLND
jgi:uncharacterized coiled-coil protein SlyX